MKIWIYALYGSWLTLMLLLQTTGLIYIRMAKDHADKMEIKERQDKIAADRERQENEHARQLAIQEKLALERAKVEAEAKKEQDELRAKMEKERPKLIAEEAAIREKERIAKEKREKIQSIKSAKEEYEMQFPIPGQNGKTIDQYIIEVTTILNNSNQNRSRNDNSNQLRSILRNLNDQKKMLANNGINFAKQQIVELENHISDIENSVIDPTIRNGSKKGSRLSFTSVANKISAKTNTEKDIERIKKYLQTMEDYEKQLDKATKE